MPAETPPPDHNHPPIAVAIVGCGRMGRLHSERILADGRAHIAVYGDPRIDAARALGAEFAPQAVAIERWEQILASEVDAVILCTPTDLHYEQAAAALRRGRHVLCEKPLARTRAQIVELIELQRSVQRVLHVGYQRRVAAAYRTMRRIVLPRELGAIRAVTSYNAEDWQQTIGGTWRDDSAANQGGFIGDAGSHKIDSVFFVTELKPVEVFARCRNWGSRVEITASISALLTEDVPLTMEFIGNAQSFREMLTIHCEQGDLILRDGALFLAQRGRVEPFAFQEPESNPIAAFLDSVVNGAINPAPPECALPVFDFTQAVLESSHCGRNVQLL